MGRRADASLAWQMRFHEAPASKSPPRAPRIHSTARIRASYGGAPRVMLDKVEGDMVHLRHDPGPRKEKCGLWDNNFKSYIV